MHKYRLFLTSDEQQALESLGEREEYAALLWNIALPDGSSKTQFVVERSDAYSWKESVDSAMGILPRAQGTLRTKLQKLYDEIH